jgi:hypothetical protein
MLHWLDWLDWLYWEIFRVFLAPEAGAASRALVRGFSPQGRWPALVWRREEF